MVNTYDQRRLLDPLLEPGATEDFTWTMDLHREMGVLSHKDWGGGKLLGGRSQHALQLRFMVSCQLPFGKEAAVLVDRASSSGELAYGTWAPGWKSEYSHSGFPTLLIHRTLNALSDSIARELRLLHSCGWLQKDKLQFLLEKVPGELENLVYANMVRDRVATATELLEACLNKEEPFLPTYYGANSPAAKTKPVCPDGYCYSSQKDLKETLTAAVCGRLNFEEQGAMS